MSAYASVEDFENYVEGWETDDQAALERILERASRDVDRFVGAQYRMQDNGYRFGDLTVNPQALTQGQIDAVKRSTCAQAEYRITKGEEWFVEDQYEAVSGPDFATKGKLPRFGPKAREELRNSGIVKATGGRLLQ